MSRRIIAYFSIFFIMYTLSACQTAESRPITTTSRNETTSIQAEQPNHGNTSEMESDADINWPLVEEGFWKVYDIRCDMTYYDYFSRWNILNFKLVSAVPLQEENVQVSSADGWKFVAFLDPYDPYYAQDAKCYLYEDVFLLFQGVTAEEQNAFQYGKLTKERTDEVWEYLNAYREIEKDDLPVLYMYILQVTCQEPPEDPAAVLTEVDVTVNGKTQNFSVGNVCTVYDERDYRNDDDFNLNCKDNLSYLGYGVPISSEGTITFRKIKYTADSDLTLTGLSFYRNNEIEIQEISVTQEVEEDCFVDISWDGIEPLELSARDVIYLTVKATDPWFAGTSGGWKSEYLLLEYQVGDKSYSLDIPFYCQQTLGDAFAYIALDQGYDVLPLYYRDT